MPCVFFTSDHYSDNRMVHTNALTHTHTDMCTHTRKHTRTHTDVWLRDCFLPQMVEAMPQTPEVEEFLRAIVPLSDGSGEGGGDGGGGVDGEEEEVVEDDRSQRSEDTESDNEEEFHDSMTDSQYPAPLDVSIIVHIFISI